MGRQSLFGIGLIQVPGTTGPSAPVPDMLLHFEGANGSTTCTDSSASPTTFTRSMNGEKITNTKSAFGRCCADFSTYGYWYSGSTSKLAFTGKFTIRFKCYNVAAYVMLYGGSWGGGLSDFWGIQTSGNQLGFQFNGWHPSDAQLPYNVWCDIEVCRDASNVVRMFLDGVNVLEFTQAGACLSGAGALHLGGWDVAGASWYMDEFKIYNGTCLHTAAFDPVPMHTGDPIYLTLKAASSISMTVTGTSGAVIAVDWDDGNSTNYTMTGSPVTIAHTYSGSGTYIIALGGAFTSITGMNFNDVPISAILLPASNAVTSVSGDNSSLSSSQVNALLANLVANAHTGGTISLLLTKLPTGQGLTDETTLTGSGWTISITGNGVSQLTYSVMDDWSAGYGDGTYTPYEGTVPDGSSVYICASAFYGEAGYLTVTPVEGGYLWAVGMAICTTMYGSGSWGCGVSSTAPNTSGTAVYINGGYGENGFPAGYTFTPQ